MCLGSGDKLSETELRRLARNIGELDNRCRLISNEISDFGARIATFNIEPFQLETAWPATWTSICSGWPT